jgi:hypothetical protein
MSFHLSLFKMVGLHYMPFFACHDCKDNTSSAAGLKIYRIQLSGDELRLAPSTVTQHLAALRFFYIKTLRKPWSIAETPYPKKVQRLPIILSPEEVT